MSILVTGGTGTFGRAFVRQNLLAPILRSHLIRPEKIVIYSRDEQKQEEMARELAPIDPHQRLRFFLGDVRDESRLRSAMRDIDTVVHAAALKIVPKCEYDPIEAVRTNVGGAENIIQASIACGVRRVIALSTDKAVAPVNLYGATKLTAERLFIAANHLSGATGNQNATRFSIVRYGNVAGSRGSVIPLFKKLVAEGKPLPITHPKMTRFWITIEAAVDFVIQRLDSMWGGEVFIPRMPSFRITDLAMAIDKVSLPPWKIVGMRPGEKIHETLITSHDTPRLVRHPDHFVIEPEWKANMADLSDFSYSSDTNDEWLSIEDLRGLTQ
jgi:UDP-N-acetylglucosamine 4,6-dehydratase/5-epimerase